MAEDAKMSILLPFLSRDPRHYLLNQYQLITDKGGVTFNEMMNSSITLPMSLLIIPEVRKNYCHSMRSNKIIIVQISGIISKEVLALEEINANMHI